MSHSSELTSLRLIKRKRSLLSETMAFSSRKPLRGLTLGFLLEPRPDLRRSTIYHLNFTTSLRNLAFKIFKGSLSRCQKNQSAFSRLVPAINSSPVFKRQTLSWSALAPKDGRYFNLNWAHPLSSLKPPTQTLIWFSWVHESQTRPLKSSSLFSTSNCKPDLNFRSGLQDELRTHELELPTSICPEHFCIDDYSW